MTKETYLELTHLIEIYGTARSWEGVYREARYLNETAQCKEEASDTFMRITDILKKEIE